MNIRAINIIDELELSGEEKLRENLSTFSCRVNPAIESFIRNRAIDFAKRKLSITYLPKDSQKAPCFSYGDEWLNLDY